MRNHNSIDQLHGHQGGSTSNVPIDPVQSMQEQVNFIMRSLNELVADKRARDTPPQPPPVTPHHQQNAGGHRMLHFDREGDPRYMRRDDGYRENWNQFDRPEDPRKHIEVTLPTFNNNGEPQLYLEWELRVDKIFHRHPTLTEDNKVKLAIVALRGPVSRWWAFYCQSMREEGSPQVNHWAKLKQIMKNRYAPNSFFCDMFNRLNSLKQGSLTVREYYLTLEDLIRRSGIKELEENTMARFLEGLNIEIARPVNRYRFRYLTELVEYACTIERDLKIYAISSYRSTDTKNVNWQKDNWEYNGTTNKSTHPIARTTPLPPCKAKTRLKLRL